MFQDGPTVTGIEQQKFGHSNFVNMKTSSQFDGSPEVIKPSEFIVKRKAEGKCGSLSIN